MVTKKNRSTPVVEKREIKDTVCGCKDCTCGEDCQCGCKCGCGCGKTLLLCGTMLVSSAIIAASIAFSPCRMQHKPFMPVPPRKEMPRVEQALDKDVVNGMVKKFIQENPKVILDSVEKHYQAEEAKAAKAEPKKFDLNDLEKADAALVKQVIDDKTNYSLGNAKGKFVIIEFFDYNCGWCKRTNAAMEEVIASPAGKNIRWIPIDTPIFGEKSEIIARYVLAAGEQGKYADMHKAVGEATGVVDEAALTEMAKKLKLNVKKLAADAKGEKITQKLASNDEFRRKLNISGVPMLIVDGRINRGALFGPNLDEVVKASAAKK